MFSGKFPDRFRRSFPICGKVRDGLHRAEATTFEDKSFLCTSAGRVSALPRAVNANICNVLCGFFERYFPFWAVLAALLTTACNKDEVILDDRDHAPVITLDSESGFIPSRWAGN